MVLIFPGCGEEQNEELGGEEYGEEEEEEEEDEGEPTGALCPDDSTLTYANFGDSFMATYCTSCHSGGLSGSARQGAPLGYDFDTLEGILDEAHEIDKWAAAGPNAINEAMPTSGPEPSLAERQMLGEWLACEAAP